MSASKNKKIRTRFAPSPTGFLHIGGLRTALYEYLLAKQNKGDFILRVEDTDQTREVEGAVESLLKSLLWAGVEPDEGVLLDKTGKITEKGKFGPYTQSKRLDIYTKYAKELLANKKAYHCFCSSERLSQLRKDQQAAGKPTHYDKKCLSLTEEEVKSKIESGEGYVVRMNVEPGKKIEFVDGVRGRISFNTSDVDDQVILKSDGFPTYHLASVVDDHLMEITHVVRGEEWLPSTPKHILLYQALDWQAPEFIHISLILNKDKSKLSKRQGDVSVEDYMAQGYLPEALVNFISLLGWNPGTEQEIFSIDELIKIFDIAKLHRAGAVLDRDKLDWMNGEYIRSLKPAVFNKLAMPVLTEKFENIPDFINTDLLLKVEQERVDKISEVGDQVKFCFDDTLDYKPKDLVWKKSNKEDTVKYLELLVTELASYKKWDVDTLEKNIIEFIAKSGLKNGDVLWPMRYAITGIAKSPTPFEVATILGKDKSLERLNLAIKKLK
jgi:nondiscriminating glutamyl-tRNA synthetase